MMVSRLGLAGVNLGHCYRFDAVIGARQNLRQWWIVVPGGRGGIMLPKRAGDGNIGVPLQRCIGFWNQTDYVPHHTG